MPQSPSPDRASVTGEGTTGGSEDLPVGRANSADPVVADPGPAGVSSHASGQVTSATAHESSSVADESATGVRPPAATPAGDAADDVGSPASAHGGPALDHGTAADGSAPDAAPVMSAARKETSSAADAPGYTRFPGTGHRVGMIGERKAPAAKVRGTTATSGRPKDALPASERQAFVVDTLTDARYLVTFSEKPTFPGKASVLGAKKGNLVSKNGKLVSKNRKLVVGKNGKPISKNRKLASGNRASADRNAQPLSGNRKLGIRKGRLVSGNGKLVSTQERYRYYKVDPDTGKATEVRANPDAAAIRVQSAGGREPVSSRLQTTSDQEESFLEYDHKTGLWDVTNIGRASDSGRPYQLLTAPPGREIAPEGPRPPMQAVYTDPEGGSHLLTYDSRSPMPGTGYKLSADPGSEAKDGPGPGLEQPPVPGTGQTTGGRPGVVSRPVLAPVGRDGWVSGAPGPRAEGSRGPADAGRPGGDGLQVPARAPRAEGGGEPKAVPVEGYRFLDGDDTGWKTGPPPLGAPKVQRISRGPGHRMDGKPDAPPAEFLVRDPETGLWTLVEKAPSGDKSLSGVGTSGRSYFRLDAGGGLKSVEVRAETVEVLRWDPVAGNLQRVDVIPSGDGEAKLDLGADGALTDRARVTPGDLRGDPVSGQVGLKSIEPAESPGWSVHGGGDGKDGGRALRPGPAARVPRRRFSRPLARSLRPVDTGQASRPRPDSAGGSAGTGVERDPVESDESAVHPDRWERGALRVRYFGTGGKNRTGAESGAGVVGARPEAGPTGAGTAARPGGEGSKTRVQPASARSQKAAGTGEGDSAKPDSAKGDAGKSATGDPGGFAGQGRALGDGSDQPVVHPGSAERADAFEKLLGNGRKVRPGARPGAAQRPAPAQEQVAAARSTASPDQQVPAVAGTRPAGAQPARPAVTTAATESEEAAGAAGGQAPGNPEGTPGLAPTRPAADPVTAQGDPRLSTREPWPVTTPNSHLTPPSILARAIVQQWDHYTPQDNQGTYYSVSSSVETELQANGYDAAVALAIHLGRGRGVRQPWWPQEVPGASAAPDNAAAPGAAGGLGNAGNLSGPPALTPVSDSASTGDVTPAVIAADPGLDAHTPAPLINPGVPQGLPPSATAAANPNGANLDAVPQGDPVSGTTAPVAAAAAGQSTTGTGGPAHPGRPGRPRLCGWPRVSRER